MSRLVISLLLGMASCVPTPPTQNEDTDTAMERGEVLLDGTLFFPMDGERTWVFQTPVLPYRLVGHKPTMPMRTSTKVSATGQSKVATPNWAALASRSTPLRCRPRPCVKKWHGSPTSSC